MLLIPITTNKHSRTHAQVKLLPASGGRYRYSTRRKNGIKQTRINHSQHRIISKAVVAVVVGVVVVVVVVVAAVAVAPAATATTNTPRTGALPR